MEKRVSSWVITQSVFYLYGIDWIYFQDRNDWVVVVGVN